MTHPATWRNEDRPRCCGEMTKFIASVGIAEIRRGYPELEGSLLSHIVYAMGIPGEAASALLESLDRNAGQAVSLFECPTCHEYQFHIAGS